MTPDGGASPRLSEQPRAWQRMLSGRRLDLLHPRPDDIDIDDIAHGLARVARWNGQTRGPNCFSVAQHSTLVEAVATLIEPDLRPDERLAALLHDAPEYVIGDLISPFKIVLGDGYKAIERRLLAAVHTRYGLPMPAPALGALIKRADQIAAFAEATQLAGFGLAEARAIFGEPPDVGHLPDLAPLPPEAAASAFLERFAALQADCGPST